MEITTKALYNALRLHAIDEPQAEIDSWKTQDLRLSDISALFDQLKKKGICVDRQTFIAYANEYDTPEELVEAIIPEELDESEDRDYVYLIVFELWRRFVPEKQSISLITDELDYQIYLYDNEALESFEPLDDAIACLYEVLEENADLGVAPKDAFAAILEYSAHDIFTFLYDYISELIELEQYVYAQDLVERFFPFIEDKKWFEFLHAQLIAVKEPKACLADIKKIAQENQKDSDIQLFLDMLAFLCKFHSKELFCQIAKDVLKQDLDEDDLQEFLFLSKEFFSVHTMQEHELKVEEIEAQSNVVQDKAEQKNALKALYSSIL